MEIGLSIATYVNDMMAVPHITKLHHRGLAALSGCMQIGDMIISVDDHTVHACTDVRHAICDRVGHVSFRLRRQRDLREEDDYLARPSIRAELRCPSPGACLETDFQNAYP